MSAKATARNMEYSRTYIDPVDPIVSSQVPAYWGVPCRYSSRVVLTSNVLLDSSNRVRFFDTLNRKSQRGRTQWNIGSCCIFSLCIFGLPSRLQVVSGRPIPQFLADLTNPNVFYEVLSGYRDERQRMKSSYRYWCCAPHCGRENGCGTTDVPRPL